MSDSNSKKSDYVKAIIADNCLGKRSQKNRELSARHLMTLYSLDPSANTFEALRYFWTRDIEAQPLLALLSRSKLFSKSDVTTIFCVLD